MNQHTIQRSYLAQFAYKGKVRVFEKSTLEFEDLKPKDTGYLIDFQSNENELLDQQLESKAINHLCSMKKGRGELHDHARELVDRWVALHLSRNPREIAELCATGLSYDRAKLALFEDSLRTVSSFEEVWRYEIPDLDEPLFVSDQPIMYLATDAIVFPFGAKVLIVISNGDPRTRINLSGRNWGEVLNEMSFFSTHKRFFCRPNSYPNLDDVAKRAETIRLEIKKDTLRI